MQERFGVSERWACRVVGQHRSTQRYQSEGLDADAMLRALLREISAERPRWGIAARMSTWPSSGTA